MMKILYDYQIVCNQKFGGVSRYHYELMNKINKITGVHSELRALFSCNYYFMEYFRREPVKDYHHLKRLIVKINQLYMKLIIQFGKFDIIHPTWHDPYIIEPKHGKIVITVHDMIHEILPNQSQREIENKKKSIYAADLIIAISENTKQDILRIYPDIQESKIEVIYHGTNHLPKPSKPEEIDIPDRYILFVGKRKDYKNGMWLGKVLKEYLTKWKIKIFYVGGGQFTEKEINLLKEWKIENEVLQYDASDAELAFLYRNALCFVYPSKYEGFGFPILEAFDNGCPVICNNSSCLPEIGGDAAQYFDYEYPEELIDIIDRLNYDEELRQDFIIRGKQRVKEFTWEETAKKTCEAYKKIMYKDMKV